MSKTAILAALALVFSFSGLAAPSIDVQKNSDGSELTLDIDAEDVGGVRINQIPSTWTVENKKEAGSIFTSDTSEGYAAWAWASDKSAVDISITFAKENSGEESLKLTAENSDGEQTVEDVLIGSNDEKPKDSRLRFNDDFSDSEINEYRAYSGSKQNLELTSKGAKISREGSGEDFFLLKDRYKASGPREASLRFKVDTSNWKRNAYIIFTSGEELWTVKAAVQADNLLLARNGEVLEKKPLDIKDGEWHEMKVDIKGDTLRFYLDGDKELTYSKEVNFQEGVAGFGNRGDIEHATVFRDFRYSKSERDSDEPGDPGNNPPTSGKDVIFEEDFNTDLKDWENIHGKGGKIVEKNGEKALWLHEGPGSSDSVDNYLRYELDEEVKPGVVEFTVLQESLCNSYCRSNEIMLKPEEEVGKGTKNENNIIELDFKHRNIGSGQKVTVNSGAQNNLENNPFDGGWKTFKLYLDWEEREIEKLSINGEKVGENFEFQGEVDGIKAIDINRGYYASEDIWVDSVKVYNKEEEDSTFPEDPVDPTNPVQRKQDSISFEDGAFSSISSNGPLKIVKGETKTSGKNGYEVSQKHSTEGQNSLHLASYGSLNPIKIGFKADLTDVEKLVYDGYPEANNAMNGDIKVYAGGKQISNELVFHPMGEPAPEEDVWHEDIEEDVSSIEGEEMVSFRVRGSGNDAYFDNIRFLNSEGEEITGEVVGSVEKKRDASEYLKNYPEVEQDQDGDITIEPDTPENQVISTGNEITQSEIDSASETIDEVEKNINRLNQNIDPMIDYYKGRDSEKAQAWTEVQIKISAADSKIESIRSKLQSARNGDDIAKSEITNDIETLQTGIQKATDLILEA